MVLMKTLVTKLDPIQLSALGFVIGAFIAVAAVLAVTSMTGGPTFFCDAIPFEPLPGSVCTMIGR